MGPRRLGLFLIAVAPLGLLLLPVLVLVKVADLLMGLLIGCALLLWGEDARPIAISYGEKHREILKRKLERWEKVLRKYYYPQLTDLEKELREFSGK